MKLTKSLIIFIFLLAFVLQVSAQDKTPKIVWKNMQEKYEKFEHIKPIIVNQNSYPIYIDCTLDYFERNLYGHVDQSYNTKLLMFDEEQKMWLWNVGICGTFSKAERTQLKKRNKELQKLLQEGKYGCKVNPNEEYALNFNDTQWKNLINGDGIGPTYNFGTFKFEIYYWWFNSSKDNGRQKSESLEFLVTSKKDEAK